MNIAANPAVPGGSPLLSLGGSPKNDDKMRLVSVLNGTAISVSTVWTLDNKVF